MHPEVGIRGCEVGSSYTSASHSVAAGAGWVNM
jgi:hypothetical protein